jgi:pyrroline-5-carboxylate reductase
MKVEGKIGFIGGGQMGEALIKGILLAKLITADRILVMDPAASRRTLLADRYAVGVHEHGAPIWSACGIVILAVKPQVMKTVLQENRALIGKNHLLISIAAGVPLSFFEQHTPADSRIIRVMPNTAALVLEAASALSAGTCATPDDMAVATAIFEAIGRTVIVDESQLDAVTGLSGSGPAYVFTFIEALIDAGLRVGLSRPVAETLVLQTVLGATKLAMAGNEHPAQLRAMVTSPGGTTIAGLHTLESAGFTGIIMSAVEAATKRSAELGR